MLVTLLRKPLEGNTVSALPCGGLNIHASRVGESGAQTADTFDQSTWPCPLIPGLRKVIARNPKPYGRFPANLLFHPNCGGTEHFMEVAYDGHVTP